MTHRLPLAALLAGVVLSCAAAPSWAGACAVRVLRPVTDDVGNAWLAGRTLPMTLFRSGPAAGGRGAFCAHGGGCLPADAVRLVGCRIGPRLAGSDDRALTPLRASAETTPSGVEARLAALGLSNAAAASAANAYVKAPGSPNGRLVARALGGAPEAIATLRDRF